MDVNKYKIRLNPNTTNNLTVPIGINWDFLNRGDTIDAYQETAVDEAIGEPVDYEVTRFGMKPILENTQLNHTFYFYNADISDYENSYVIPNRFNAYQLFYNTTPFKKSLFKLDFYDSTNVANQKIYLSIILSTRLFQPKEIKQYRNKDYSVKKPKFELDYLGEREGYFIYFFEDYNVLELDKLYMSAKFFSGIDGQFTTFSIKNQNDISLRYEISDEDFYYQVNLNYSTNEYEFVDQNGIQINQLNWYEYTNPQ
jgi:hypothetical protein